MRKRTTVIFMMLLLLFSGVVWRLYALTREGSVPAAEQQSTLTVISWCVQMSRVRNW